MKKLNLLFFFMSLLSYSQTQIGADIDGAAAYDESAESLALSADGTTVAIGSTESDGNGEDSGQVRIFQNISGNWIQKGNSINGEDEYDNSSGSIAISADGNIVAIGAAGNSSNLEAAGHVRVFQYISGAWSQIGTDIDGLQVEELSGYSISLSADGSIVAIGSPNAETGSYIRVFQNVSGNWVQLGSNIIGLVPSDRYGGSIKLSANGLILANADSLNSTTGQYAGQVRVFQYASGTWSQIGSNINAEAANDRSGEFGALSLSADGSIIAIGARQNDGNGNNSGHVRIFQNILGTWTQIGSDIDGEAAGDLSGTSVSLSSDGTIVAIGATTNDGNGTDSGQLRIFKNTSGSWVQVGNDINGESAGDGFGYTTSLSANGSIVAGGTPYNSGNGLYAGHVRIYNLASVLKNDIFGSKKLILYPNPSKNFISFQNIENSTENFEYKIYDLTGRLVNKGNSNFKKQLSIENLTSGNYSIKIETQSGECFTQKLIKQ